MIFSLLSIKQTTSPSDSVLGQINYYSFFILKDKKHLGIFNARELVDLHSSQKITMASILQKNTDT